MTADHNKLAADNLLRLSTDLEHLTSERTNSNSEQLDQMSALEIAALMNAEDKAVAAAVENTLPAIANAIELATAALKAGGRIVYVGAGTSGRIGILDASEIPPTFSASPELFHAIIAGGEAAIFRAQEGVEDDMDIAIKDIKNAKVSANDLVIGLAASGRTPYVLAALNHAKTIGAHTVGISCNAGSALEKNVDVAITPLVGPEILAGSTRLKSGTAQKMVLNMISTGSMVQFGKCYKNRMVDLNITNQKLRARAVNLVRELSTADQHQALKALEESDWNVKLAILICEANLDLEAAKKFLADGDGHLRKALQLAQARD